MLNKLDYSYNGEESIIHRMNPVVKLFGLFIYVLVCMFKFNNILFIVNISIVFLLLLLSNINIFKYLKIIWKLKYILIIMYAYMYHKEMDFFDMNVIVFKFVFLILYIAMLVYTTTKVDLGKGGAKAINIFNLIGISFTKISTFITNIFVFIEEFIEESNEVITNLEIKGKDYTHSNIVGRIKLFFKNLKLILSKTKNKMRLRKSDMKYKLYNGNVKSQYKYRNKLCIFDYLFIILNIGMVVFYILKVR